MATRRKPYRDEANGVWSGSVWLGRDAKGKPIRRKVSHATFDGAAKKLAKLEQDLASGRIPLGAPDKVTTGQWMRRFIEETARAKVNLDTYVLYDGISRNHVEPYVGAVLLRKLAPLHLDTMFAALERKGVGRRTQQLAHVVVGQALKKALALDMIGTNPLARIPKPAIDRRRVQVKRTWTVEHVRAFLVAASQHRLAALFVLAVAAGMRQSEILGLTKACVDVKGKCLRVELGLHEVRIKDQDQRARDPRVPPGLELRPPKTAASERTIALPKIAADALAAHLAAASTAGVVSPFVFTDEEGGPIRARTFSTWWKSCLRGAGIPFLAFKQLRHTCLTLLAEEGVPLKAAQHLAGHSTPQLTAGVYQQATQRLARQAADAMDRVLDPTTPQLEHETERLDRIEPDRTGHTRPTPATESDERST